MRSTRLPGKVLRPILGRPMLDLMIERLRRARTLEVIVVATTDQPADDPIVGLARELQVEVFRGSEEDVLARVLGAALTHDIDIIVETTGDSPLIDPGQIDKVVSDYRSGGADFVSNTLPLTTPRGTDVRVFATAALEAVSRLSSDPADREHVSLYFWEHPDQFRVRNVASQFRHDAAALRVTVDTAEDLEVVTRVYESLYPKNPAFTLQDVVEFLQQNPHLAAINRSVQQAPVRAAAV